MRKPKDWGQACPNPDCTHYRLMKRGNISAISTYLTQSGKRRIFLCRSCKTTFSEARDTVFFDLRTPQEKVMMALKMLRVKVALTDIGFVLGVTEETVLMWLERAAQKAHEINTHLLKSKGRTVIHPHVGCGRAAPYEKMRSGPYGLLPPPIPTLARLRRRRGLLAPFLARGGRGNHPNRGIIFYR